MRKRSAGNGAMSASRPVVQWRCGVRRVFFRREPRRSGTTGTRGCAPLLLIPIWLCFSSAPALPHYKIGEA